MSETANANPNFAWFGKLPSAGDFVSRRMPYPLQQYWDQWCANGVEVLKERNPVSGWALWGAMPKWAFLIPAQQGIPIGQLGVIAPSCDRVGRNFPFLVTTPLLEESVKVLLPRAATLANTWADAIMQAQAARASMDTLDVQLSDIFTLVLAQAPVEADGDVTLPQGANPHTLPWPELAENFELRGAESYWWSVPPTQTGFRAKTHIGPLSAAHFFSLCL
jgi:type VI secretion system protein ImpM